MKFGNMLITKKSAVFISTAIMIGGCNIYKNAHSYESLEHLINNSRDEIAAIIELENIQNTEIYTNYERLVGAIEIKNFKDFFFGNQKADINLIINKVIDLQREFGINQDGFLGPITLRNIYLNHYSKNIEKLNHDSKKRLKIYNEMLGYKEKPKAIIGNFDIFKKETYYGNNMGVNIYGTYINERLVGIFPENLDSKENLITFKNVNGMSALAFYIDGKLELATFSSPGITSGRAFTPRLNTIGQRNPSKLHISSSYPNKINTIKGGAIMPYAVHVNGLIRIHGSDSIIDGTPASAGCIRVGLYYMEYLHSKVSQLGIKNVRIDTRNIY